MKEDKLLICKLCLENNSEFELLNVLNNDIDAILQQFSHFKFEDSFANIGLICTECWLKVEDFHQFCTKIAKVHEEAMRLAESALGTRSDFTDDLMKVEDQAVGIETDEEEIKAEIITDVEEDELNSGQLEEHIQSTNGGNEDDGHSTEEDESHGYDTRQAKAKRSNVGGKSDTAKPKRKNRLPKVPQVKKTLKEQLDARVDYQKAEIDYNFVKEFMRLNCDICKEAYSTFDESQKHFLDKHKRAAYWKCCKLNFETVHEVADHMRYHRDPTIFKCSACDRVCRTTEKLNLHTNLTHFKEIKVHQCKTCSRAFKRLPKLLAHEKRHISINCPHCSKSITVANLELHIRCSHSDTKKVMCDLCGKVSWDKHAHRLHYAVEHSGIDQRLQCDLCKKWVKHKKQMTKHMSKHFQTPQTCDICGKTVPNRYALSHHMQRHQKPKHKCSYCGKAFRLALQVREHESIHLGIKELYQCDFCDKTFRFSSGLYAHRKRDHPQQYLTLRINSN